MFQSPSPSLPGRIGPKRGGRSPRTKTGSSARCSGHERRMNCGHGATPRQAPHRKTYEVTSTHASHKHAKFLKSVIRWLDVGYPQGVPGPDQVALFALLQSTPLTDGSARRSSPQHHHEASRPMPTARSTATRSPSSSPQTTNYDPGRDNIQRVAATLAAAGWPLAGIDVSEVFRVMKTGRQPKRLHAVPRCVTGLRCR